MPISSAESLKLLSHVLPFSETLQERFLDLSRREIHTLQLNVGKLCNQICRHCHVEAGPKRTEMMKAETADRILELLSNSCSIQMVDITGGAPELCPEFRRLVKRSYRMGKRVLDRCNLTVFFEKGQENLPEFLAEHQVTIMASLPCYSLTNVDKQRGKGVFGKSIEALLRLNKLGYAKPGSPLILDLVYNPMGASLPPPQKKLERDYKDKLKSDFGIEFNHLYCITNMPIKRFLEDLLRQKRLDEYMNLLLTHFNPLAAEAVMCRNLVSISWDGKIYDCDFNQMLEIPVPGKAQTIWEIDSFASFNQGPITFHNHCYGCTAGSGSSCNGNTTNGF